MRITHKLEQHLRTKNMQIKFVKTCFVKEEKNCNTLSYYKQIWVTFSTKQLRTKIVSKCRHKAKYEPRNHQPNETTFNANWLVTVLCDVKCRFVSTALFKILSVFHNVCKHAAAPSACQQCLIKMLSLHC